MPDSGFFLFRPNIDMGILYHQIGGVVRKSCPRFFFCRRLIAGRVTLPGFTLFHRLSVVRVPGKEQLRQEKPGICVLLESKGTRQRRFGEDALDPERARGSCQNRTKGTLNNALTKRNPRVPQHFPMMRVGTSEHGVVQGLCPWIEI